MAVAPRIPAVTNFNICFRSADLSRDRGELKDNALRFISHALQETYYYYQGLERNHETESQLSKYWAAAVIPIRHIEKHLSMLCDQKPAHWINPDGWGPQEVKNVGISLDKVRKRYRELLNPGFGSLGKNR